MNMGAQTLESELAQVSADTGIESNKSFLLEKENGKSNQDMGIKFGSHLTDEPSKKEVENLPESKFPKDAADDWPEPKQVHQIYMVKYRPYEDQKVKAKLDLSEKELRKLRDIEYQIREKLRAEKVNRYEAVGKLKAVGEERRHFWSIMDEKKKEMEPLQQALGKLRGSNAGGRERSLICHSEEELNNVIKSLQYRIQHESIPLSEEKQIIREIKQLEGTRDQVKANVVARAEIEDALGEKQAIQDQVKLIGVGLDGVRKEHKDVTAKRDILQAEKDKIDDAINALENELQGVIEKIKTVISRMKDLQKQLSAGNESFYQNRTSLNKARELAVKKDVEGLKELVGNEVDHFISQWNSSKAFRDDYERRILQSLDMRQLSRDGRMRNPDEKPLVVQEPPTAIKTEVKPNLKQVKEESSTSTVRKASKEKSIKQENEATHKVGPEATVGKIDVDDREAISVLEKLEKDPPLKKNAVDEVKLKELKREEEMAKAKQALERKKKLAEKAAAKAAIKAHKEAEKKLKDREKKAKKKAAVSASVTLEEPSESADDVAEPENTDEIVEAAAPASSKNKERKEKTARHRGKAKGVDSFPKVVLKRKKSTNYWVWAAPAALIVMLLIVIGYYYLI